MKKRLSYLSMVLTLSFFLSSCSLVAQPANIETESPNVSLTGTILNSNGKYTINSAEKGLVELNSREVDLSTYAGKSVTVTGQYSGTTLFVSTVE